MSFYNIVEPSRAFYSETGISDLDLYATFLAPNAESVV